MKKLSILFVFALIANILFAQHEDIALLGRGNALFEIIYYDLELDSKLENLDTSTVEGKIRYEILSEQKEEILETSLEYFEELIEEYPESELYFRAMNNAAAVSNQLGYEDEAIKYYKTILGSKAKDNEKGGVGFGIMAEPYALYKNRACKYLAEIYIARKEYTQAIKYIDLTETYPYQHFCGNEYAANDIYIATLYTKSYRGLGDTKKALNYSLPQVFNSGLANNRNLVELTVEILKEDFDLKAIKKELEKASKEYYTEKRKKEKYEWIEYCITFLDIKIELPSYDLELAEDIDQAVKDIIEKSYFMELLK